MSSALADKSCVPCEAGTPPLTGAELAKLETELGGDWKVIDGHHLEKEYRLKDFVQALALVNRIGEMAEEQIHHPDLHLSWGRVRVVVWTHDVGGLSEGDFVFAAKADRLAEALAG